jgi:hypothetical protein
MEVKMPEIIWLANVALAAIIVTMVFIALKLVVQPPRSAVEGVFEAHKVVVVGGITLAGVAVIEAILLAGKLSNEDASVVAIGGIVLLTNAFLGLGLFLAAIAGDEGVRNNPRISKKLIVQLALGLLVFGISVYVAYKYKYIDARILSELQMHRSR